MNRIDIKKQEVYQVIKKVWVNGREQVRVLNLDLEFVLERFFLGKEWKTYRGAEKTSKRFNNAEVRKLLRKNDDR